jgi:hypothetical protein
MNFAQGLDDDGVHHHDKLSLRSGQHAGVPLRDPGEDRLPLGAARKGTSPTAFQLFIYI